MLVTVLVMAVAEDAIANILDNSIELSAQYNIDPRSPFVKEIPVEEIAEPLTLEHLPLRPTHGLRKVYVAFDIHRGVDKTFTPLDVAKEFVNTGAAGLPEGVKPQCPVPDSCIQQLALVEGVGNKIHFVKQYYFPNGIAPDQAAKLAVGEFSTVLFRDGGWNFKKAVQMILERIPGIHGKRWALSKQRVVPEGEQGSKKWRPSKEDLGAGVELINKNVEGLDESENEMLEWT